MSACSRVVWGGVLVAAAAVGVAGWSVVRHGVSVRDEPTAIEVVLARWMRHLAIPRRARETKNPVPATPEVLAEAREHFADHCASCHGNDGRGRTEMGRNLYPKAPDMTLAETQRLSDGEIFFIVENGIRLTGMPAWGEGTAHSTLESWGLVHFIRHLPELAPEELEAMKEMNPRSKHELDEEQAERGFLEGSAPPPHAH